MKTIDLYVGLTLNQTYSFLQKKQNEIGEPVQGNFNGNWVNSYMTEDQIHLTITGHTKVYNDEKERKMHEDWEKHREEFKSRIPELCKETLKIVLDDKLVREDKLEEFKKMLPYRFEDCYEGNDIYNMIEINKILVNNKDNPEKAIELARQTFENQGHSNRSAYIASILVCDFCPVLGQEFYEKVFLNN